MRPRCWFEPFGNGLTILEFGVGASVNTSPDIAGKRFMVTSRESILQMVCIGRADGSMEYFDQHLLDYAGIDKEVSAVRVGQYWRLIAN